jgi:hypothetical protein
LNGTGQNFGHNLTQIDFAGTGINASPTAHTSVFIKILLHIIEFAEIPVSKPVPHLGPGRISSRHQGITVQLAGIGTADFDKFIANGFIIKDQTVTGGADIGTGSAPHTFILAGNPVIKSNLPHPFVTGTVIEFFILVFQTFDHIPAVAVNSFPGGSANSLQRAGLFD